MTTATIKQIGTWRAADVTTGQVDSALSTLRRHELTAAVRVNVLTLVVVVADQAEADAALGLLRTLGSRHPSRTIVLVVGQHRVRSETDGAGRSAKAGGLSGRDAVATILSADHGGRTYAFEELTITVRGQGRHHLHSIVEPFTFADVPMAVWMPRRRAALGDPLLAAANMAVLDSSCWGSDPAAMTSAVATHAALARRIPVSDIAWIALSSWRRAMAGLFGDGPERNLLADVDHVEVSGPGNFPLLIGGWLMQRLQLRPPQMTLASSPAISINLLNADRPVPDTCRVWSSLGAQENPASFEAEIRIQGFGDRTCRRELQAMSPSENLGLALTRFSHDPSYEQALTGAMSLATAVQSAKPAARDV